MFVFSANQRPEINARILAGHPGASQIRMPRSRPKKESEEGIGKGLDRVSRTVTLPMLALGVQVRVLCLEPLNLTNPCRSWLL